MLPSRKPLRRAMRYDGVVPLRPSDDGPPQEVSASDVAAIAGLAREQRQDGACFDIVISGYSPDATDLRERVAEREAAGATWWFEDGVAYADWSSGVPLNGLAPLRKRIARGPTGDRQT
jgi:hypothetical protein